MKLDNRNLLRIVQAGACLVVIFLSFVIFTSSMAKPVVDAEHASCAAGVLLTQGKMIYKDFACVAQMPYHPFLCAAIFKVFNTTHYLFTARMLTVVCDILLVISVIGIFKRVFASFPVTGWLLGIAEEYHLKVIEDAAQAFGAEYRFSLSGESNGRQRVKKAGSLGDAGCLSFFPTKNLAGYGDGGMVLAWDGEIAEKLRKLRVHGAGQDRYSYTLPGKNSRLDEVQAAILRVKLKYVEEWLKMRQQRASLYNKLLGEVSVPVRTPLETPYTTHTYCVYTILAPRRNELKEYLKKKGINCRVYYPVPLHLQDTYKYLGYHKGDFPVAEKVSKEVISLPVYPELPEEKLRYVVQEIRKFYS